MSRLNVDLDLVQKYNVAGPRYTSYPPATKFTDTLSWADVERRIHENNQTERDISLYFHIPFCETLCWFCGCTTVITLNHSQGSSYLNYLEKEVALMRAMLNPRRKAVQLHWGGGSPTFLQPDEIRRLGDIIHRHFTLSGDVEASVEIDPRRLTRDHILALHEVGFNRASFGVQDFNPKVQQAVHRIQPREMAEQCLNWARELGFTSVNFDLIYGLPFQTVESFSLTLDAVLTMQPDRLAVFSYAHVPWVKPAQKILVQKVLPTPEVKLQLLKMVIERLTDGGRYVYIGMDHFARPDDELAVAQRKKQLQRNFQGYSTRAGSDIYAFGMSSVSQTPDVYWQNQKELPEYFAGIDAGRIPLARGYIVTDEDKIRRDTIMRVMCDLSLDYTAMSKRLGIDFKAHFAKEIESLSGLESDGLVTRTAGGLEVTDTGRLFIRNIAMCFDNTLAPAGERKRLTDHLTSMRTSLANQWVLITGASSGIGAAAARAFAAENCRLLLGARRVDRLEAVATETRKAGAPEVRVHGLDVTSTTSVNAFAAWARTFTDKLGVLVNNAGGAKGAETVADGKDEDWEFMIQANVLGLVRVTRACLPMLVNNPGSSILNIGSQASRNAYEGGSVYCGAKAAELQITKVLRLELCGTGVRVCTIDPGFVETEFALTRFKGDAARAKKVYEGMVPLTGEDLAESLVWIASRPAHVCIDEMLIKPTDQATIQKTYRRTAQK